MEWMILPLKRYAEFAGRSRRMEFWMFFLFALILGAVAGVVDHALGFGTTTTTTGPGTFTATRTTSGPIGGLITLALFVPNLAVAIRRLHDTDRSGWWLLLVFLPVLGWIALLVFYCLEGTPGPNRFGPDPKGADLGEVFS